MTIDWGDGSPLTTTATGAVVLEPGHALRRAGHAHLQGRRDGASGDGDHPRRGGFADDRPLDRERQRRADLRIPGQLQLDGRAERHPGKSTFTSSNSFATVSDFNPPQINWGDGTPTDTSATITSLGKGKFAVIGTHSFGEETTFPYSVNVQIFSKGGSTAQTTAFATVLDAPISLAGASISGTVGQLFAGTVALLTDSYAQAPLSDFTATIDWGDGTLTTGTISQPGGTGSPFVIDGSHAYVHPQSYTITVTANDVGGSTATSTSVATMADAPLTVTAFPLTSTEGGSFVGTVGTFTTQPAGGRERFHRLDRLGRRNHDRRHAHRARQRPVQHHEQVRSLVRRGGGLQR